MCNYVKNDECVKLCDVQSFSGPDWSTSLSDMTKCYLTCFFFYMQRPKWHSIEIQVEYEMTEQRNRTATK